MDPKKATATGPKTQAVITSTPDSDMIAARAYELWMQRGCPIGSPEVDWLEAEAEIRGRIATAV
jgi:hypothetical protein